MLRKFAAVVGVAVGTASLLAVSVAHALGLGDITPGSGLNQPLKAQIELVSLRGVSPGEIKATMAPVDEFERAGIERSYALNDLKLEVEGTANGEAIIKLRTNEAVREPFLNFIVELNWPSGRLLREYTLLLDPPTFAEEAPLPVSRPRPAAAVASSGAVSTAAEPVTYASPTQAPVQSPVQDNALAGSNSFGPVGSTDTLWNIASRVRPSDSVTVQQTLVAIFKANPQAFSNNNPNQMKAGETLRIPSPEEIAAVPHRRAMAEFVSAGAVVETGRRSGGSAAGSSGSGRLSLAAPPEKYSTGKGGSSREAAEVLNQENEALRGEIGKLVDKNQKLEKLVQLKDQQLSAVTGKPLPSTAVDTSSKTPVVTEPTPTMPAEVPPTDGAASGVDTEPQGLAQEAKPEPKKDKPKKKPVTPSKPEETSFLTSLLGENAVVILLGLLGVIALVVGFLVYKRRQVAEENFHESLLPDDQMDDSPVRLDDSFDLPEVGEDFLAPPPTPISTSASSSAGGSQEVVADPLGESDIYIAYGKYEQAEQLLTRALQDQPNRHELRVKLLECYAEMQDQSKFRDQVAMFQDALDADPQLAKQVEKLQQRAWPKDNFSRTAPQPIPSADDIFGSSPSASSAAPAAPKESDWAPARKQPVADNFDNDGEFALDLDTDLSSSNKASEPVAMAEDSSLDDSEFSFDLDETPALNKTAAADWQPEKESASRDSSFNLDDMDADLPSGDELGMGDIDEIATKLDLARAYIEMHETDGAKEILQEVMAEGNAQQKQEAQALLAKL